MKFFKTLLLLAILTVFSTLTGCHAAEKASTQRRNLMMPEKTDLPRNSKYRAPKKRKMNNVKKRNKRKHKGHSSIYVIRVDKSFLA